MSWHFTKYGFFSSVCARENDGKGAVDPTRRMVRVRSKEHLANLRVRFPVEMEGVEVLESDWADYPARVILPSSVWVAMVAAMEEEVDYDNFKSAVGKANLTEPAYTGVLHRVWSAMRSFQDELSRARTVKRLRAFKHDLFEGEPLQRKQPPGYPAWRLASGAVDTKHPARVTTADVLGAEVVAIVSLRLKIGEPDAVPAALVLGAASRDDRTLLADMADAGMMGAVEPKHVRVDRVPWKQVDARLRELPIYDLLYEEKPTMSEPEKPKPNVIEAHVHAVSSPATTRFARRGALAEDTSVAGTEDGKIVPKDPEGLAEGATDPRERKSKKRSGPDGA